MTTEAGMFRCACGTWFNPKTSDTECPHRARTTSPLISAMLTKGRPYKVEPYAATLYAASSIDPVEDGL